MNTVKKVGLDLLQACYIIMAFIGLLVVSALAVVAVVTFFVAIFAIYLGLMYGIPGLILAFAAWLFLPLFGVSVTFGWTLFGQAVALVFVLRFLRAILFTGKVSTVLPVVYMQPKRKKLESPVVTRQQEIAQERYKAEREGRVYGSCIPYMVSGPIDDTLAEAAADGDVVRLES